MKKEGERNITQLCCTGPGSSVECLLRGKGGHGLDLGALAYQKSLKMVLAAPCVALRLTGYS